MRKVVRDRGLEQTRENLQTVGTELLEADPRGFCNAALSLNGWTPGQPLIIDGLRHIRTINIIRELIFPAKLKIVSISVTDATRLQRLEQRTHSDADSITRIEAHSSEQEIDSIRNLADWVIDGEPPVDVLVGDIVKRIRVES